MDKLIQLENRIKELEKWKAEKTAQQISFPLDNLSIDILNKFFMRITSTLLWEAGVGGNTFLEYIGKQDNIVFSVTPPSLVSYTVNVSTNYLTTNQASGNLKFFNDEIVVLQTDGTAPSPLSAGLGDQYYIINSDGYTFQLSLTSGGAAIDITDTGSGRQFITYSL